MNCYKVLYTAVTIAYGDRKGKDGVCHAVAKTQQLAGALVENKFSVPLKDIDGRKEGVEVTVTGVHEIAKDVIV